VNASLCKTSVSKCTRFHRGRGLLPITPFYHLISSLHIYEKLEECEMREEIERINQTLPEDTSSPDEKIGNSAMDKVSPQ
jgi:hypothetical protein